MITFLDEPFKGVDKETRFNILIHGFFLKPNLNDAMYALCVDEDGVLHELPIERCQLDWRYIRGKGWKSVDDPEPGD